MKILLAVALLLIAAFLALAGLLVADRRTDQAEWQRLAALQPSQPRRFDPAMVATLPEPARRYFNFAIAPGTPLWPVVEIDMGGQFGMGTKADPRYQPMEARQILAPPHGFVWSLRTRGGLPISGSDTGSWTRFRVFGLVPVARQGGTDDHRRSAFGRMVGEAAFWAPAALLPGPGVSWEAVDDNTARVTVRHGGLSQAVDLTLDERGRPVKVLFQRWSNANPEGRFQLQPFGAYPADFREVDGYRLPFLVKAGNQFGTADYFAFFVARVNTIRFPEAQR